MESRRHSSGERAWCGRLPLWVQSHHGGRQAARLVCLRRAPAPKRPQHKSSRPSRTRSRCVRILRMIDLSARSPSGHWADSGGISSRGRKPAVRASMALNRQLMSNPTAGAAGHLSGIDRAARYPTGKAHRGVSIRLGRLGGCQPPAVLHRETTSLPPGARRSLTSEGPH